MKRYFTADFHLGSERVLHAYGRPFKDIGDMNRSLIDTCNQIASSVDDLIYHIGDLYCFRHDGEFTGMDVPWSEMSKQFNATVLPLEGNHDRSNGVKCIAGSMRMVLGGRFNCVLCHYPSYDERAKLHLKPGDVNICGHAHNMWNNKRFFVDNKNKVLNINVGVDVWGYKPISEAVLTNYITHLMATLKHN